MKNLDSRHIVVRGTISNKRGAEGDTAKVAGASIMVLSIPDSAVIGVTGAGEDGRFILAASSETRSEKFLLRVTALGMKDAEIPFDYPITTRGSMASLLSIKNMGTIQLEEKELTLEEVKVLGELKKMFMKGDTLIYNTDAFNMPSGSVLIELVRRMPELAVGEGGKLMFRGTQISEIRLNGQSFFRGNMNIALYNMPTEELEQLKIYDATNGTDSLSGETKKTKVMDMKTKRNIRSTFFANAAAGTTNEWGEYLVSGDASLHRSSQSEYTLSTGISSLPSDVSVGQATGLEMKKTRPLNSKDTRKNIELSLRETLGKDWNVSGKLGHKHNNSGSDRATAREQYLTESSIFNLDEKREKSSRNANDATVSLGKSFEKIQVSLSGGVSRTESRSSSSTNSLSFVESPFVGDMSTDFSGLDMSSIQNMNKREYVGKNEGKSARVQLGISQRRQSMFGSTFSGSVSMSVSDDESESLALNDVTYYGKNGAKSSSMSSQLLLNPTKKTSLAVGVGHIYRNSVLTVESNYSFTYKDDSSERTVFKRDDNILQGGELTPEGFNGTEATDLYRNSNTKVFTHEVRTALGISNMMKQNWSLNVQGGLKPERINASTIYKNADNLDRKYDFLNWNAGAIFTRRQAGSTINLNYNVRTSSPETSLLLPVTDNSNPLLVLKGNPDLLPVMTQTASLGFNYRMFRATVNYTDNIRQIGDKTFYNMETGVQERMPVNMEGGWSWATSLSQSYMRGGFSLRGGIGYNYSVTPRKVSYGQEEMVEETQNKSFRTNLNARYGDKRWDVNANIVASWNRNEGNFGADKVSPSVSIYTLDLTLKRYFGAHWDVCAGYNNVWRNGSRLSMANGSDESVNFYVRYRFMKGLRASLTLNAFDVFGRQRNVTFSTLATGNTITKNDSKNRYVLLTFAYKFQKLW